MGCGLQNFKVAEYSTENVPEMAELRSGDHNCGPRQEPEAQVAQRSLVEAIGGSSSRKVPDLVNSHKWSGEYSKDKDFGDFPGGPVVKTLLPLQGAQVWSLMGELMCCMPWSAVRKKKKEGKKEKTGTLMAQRIFSFNSLSTDLMLVIDYILQLPRWHSDKESACQCRRCKRHGFDPWIGKIPWSRKW